MIPSRVMDAFRTVFPEMSEASFHTPTHDGIVMPSDSWSSKSSHPLFYYIILEAEAEGWKQWETESVEAWLKEKRQNVPEVNFNKILAVKASLRSTMPWESVRDFNNVSSCFSGEMPIVDMLEPNRPHECLFAMDVLKRLVPGRRFGPDVNHYVLAVARYMPGLASVAPAVVSARNSVLPKELAREYSMTREMAA